MNLTIHSGILNFNCSVCPHSRPSLFFQRSTSLVNKYPIIQNNEISNKQIWEIFFCLRKRTYHSELYLCKRMKYLNKLLSFIKWLKRLIHV